MVNAGIMYPYWMVARCGGYHRIMKWICYRYLLVYVSYIFSVYM